MEYVPSIGRVMIGSRLVVVQVVMNAAPVSFTVTFSASVAYCVPSCMVSVMVKVVSSVTEGATKVVEGIEALANVMRGAAGSVCDHVYVMGSPSGFLVELYSVTVSPSPTVWLPPTTCTDMGRLLRTAIG